MIRFSLRCAREHEFEGWFAGNEDYEKQRAEGLVVCPVCGSVQVEKMLMTPNLGRGAKAAAESEAAPAAKEPAAGGAAAIAGLKMAAAEALRAEALRRLLILRQMQQRKLEVLRKLQQLARKMRESAENVGEKFPEEARKIHFGEAEKRPIYGTAAGHEVEELREDGIEVLPLPRLPEDNN